MDDNQQQQQQHNYLLRWMAIFFGNVIIQFDAKKRWQIIMNIIYNHLMHIIFIYCSITKQLYTAMMNIDWQVKRTKILLIVLKQLYQYNMNVYLTGSLPATHMCVVLVLYFEPDDANMRRFCIYI
ncbi:uncharacterized protein LOC142645211 [Dermatophagoides pteronyssinus]|uniref:uncharacterized protein LOC142645211 n=1 Tax=Dermatophagoides pteronyssinus TaxID=6956 RepID=UPI003F66B0ED